MARAASNQSLSLTGKRWLIRDCDERRRDDLVAELGVSPIIAHLLLNRGVEGRDEARRFLAPDLNHLHEPGLLPDVEKAVERIRRALGGGERILIYGDYDADGITATSLLLQFFRLLGVEPLVYIPNRVEEGYGLHLEAVETAAAQGVQLIVTVDCGISGVAEVERARQLGVDVVITDHHEPGRIIPRACAVLNPKLTGSLYPYRELSGVGVAFKLAWAVAQTFSPGKRVAPEFRKFLLDAMALVALGTVADVVPLTGENRVFAAYGLQALRQSGSPGIAALIRAARIEGRQLETDDVAFRLAPRLNAAGRLGAAELGVELLTCDSPERAEAIARELEAKNRERQRIQTSILAAARERVAGLADWAERRTIVLADEAWHAGVVGVVAAKLAEEFHRPTILLSLNGDVARGSARSVPEFDLYAAVEACQDVLLSFGGHSQAAGLKVARERIEHFRERFEREARRQLGGREPCGLVEIDAEVGLGGVGMALVREVERLAPFGQGNRSPVLACSEVVVAGRPDVVGRQDDHLAFYVRQGNTSLRAVWFGMAKRYDTMAAGNVACDIAFVPKINGWGGTEQVDLEVRDVRLR